MCSTSYSRRLPFQLVLGVLGRGASRHDSSGRLAANIADVLAFVSHLSRNAVTQSPLHGCLVTQHWGVESDQLQHTLHSQDIDDDMSWNGASSRHAFHVDHCQLDAESLRIVGSLEA